MSLKDMLRALDRAYNVTQVTVIFIALICLVGGTVVYLITRLQ